MQEQAPIFGRQDVTQAICDWIAAPGARPAGLLVGSPGIGKSAILRKCEQACIVHDSPRWFVQHAEVNANEDASAFLHRFMMDTHALFVRRFLRQGPNDARLLATLLKSVPAILGDKGACLGDILAVLVGTEDNRPAWQRFAEYLRVVSSALRGGERLVLLIDPLRALKDEQAEDWLSVAGKLPPRIHLLIAQRPDDCIAAHPEAYRHFDQVPPHDICELPAEHIEEWYAAEFSQLRLKTLSERWSHHERCELPERAIERYHGHPFAHDALIRLPSQTGPSNPLTALAEWPADLHGLLDALMLSLRALGDDYYLAALTLQVFTIPTPLEEWAAAASLAPEQLLRMVQSPEARHFFACGAEGHFRPYHPLFAERLEQDLQLMPRRTRDLATSCWAIIAPALERERTKLETPPLFHLRAAMPLAARTCDSTHAARSMNVVITMKLRLGLLDELLNDLRPAIGDQDDEVRAAALGNAGLCYIMRGDLKRAETMLLEALELEQRLGTLDGVATVYGNLGVIYRMRGHLDRAETYLHKAIEIDEKRNELAGCARHFSNLALVYEMRDDLERAEEMLHKALQIEEDRESPEGLATIYGNLGLIYRKRGDLLNAHSMHIKALELYGQINAPVGVAVAYGNLGLIHKTRGDLARAEELQLKALEINERLGRLEGLAHAYASLGLIYTKQQNLGRAEVMHRKALEIEQLLENREGIGRQYGNLGLIERGRGNLHEAERLHRLALEIAEELGLAGEAANEYSNLGLIRRMRGNLEEAEALHRKALEVHQRVGRLEGAAIQHGNLGVIFAIRGDATQARDAWTQATDLFARIGMQMELHKVQEWLTGLSAEPYLLSKMQNGETADDPDAVLDACASLGDIYQSRGDFTRAEAVHRKALDISEAANRSADTAFHAGNIGLVYREQGDLTHAEQMHRKALAIYESLERLEGIANMCGNLGVIHSRRGETKRALQYLERARELFAQLNMREAGNTVQSLIDALLRK